MSLRELKILAAITAATVLLAALMYSLKHTGGHDEYLETLWLEGLDINAIHRIEISGAGNQQVSLERRARGWGVVERGFYPVQIGVVSTLVLDLTGAELLERKTDDPEQHAKLGLGPIDKPDAQGQLLKLIGDEVQVVRIGTRPEGRNVTYVKHDGDLQAWLVDRTFNISLEARKWLEPELLDIGMEHMHRIKIVHPDGETIKAKRVADAARFDPLNIPAGKTLKNELALNRVASAITSLSLEDVMLADEARKHLKNTPRVEYEMYEGYVLKAQLFSLEEKHYAHFEVQIKDDASTAHRQAAQQLADRLKGWVFRIPSFAYDSMSLRWGDLTQE